MKLSFKIASLICTALAALTGYGQDINFSQFYDVPLLRNPSLAGLFEGDVRVSSSFRNQWQSVTVPYKTIALGAEVKKQVGNSNDFYSVGLQLTNDIAGDSKLSRTQALLVFNYHKSLGGNNSGNYLSAGVMAGAIMQRFDATNLRFDDQFVNGAYSSANPTRQVFNTPKNHFYDATAGLSFNGTVGQSTRYYIGTGIFHITKPKVAFKQESDIQLNNKYVVNAGVSAPLNSQKRLIVYADYFMQGGAKQLQGGAMVNHSFDNEDEVLQTSISAGVFYRLNDGDAVMPVIKLDYNKFSLGVSYDVNTSKLQTASQYRGAYELTLIYTSFNNNNTDKSSIDKVRCPVF
jgi:type IX secretion system PorP/SprF family membrane protein